MESEFHSTGCKVAFFHLNDPHLIPNPSEERTCILGILLPVCKEILFCIQHVLVGFENGAISVRSKWTLGEKNCLTNYLIKFNNYLIQFNFSNLCQGKKYIILQNVKYELWAFGPRICIPLSLWVSQQDCILLEGEVRLLQEKSPAHGACWSWLLGRNSRQRCQLWWGAWVHVTSGILKPNALPVKWNAGTFLLQWVRGEIGSAYKDSPLNKPCFPLSQLPVTWEHLVRKALAPKLWAEAPPIAAVNSEKHWNALNENEFKLIYI